MASVDVQSDVKELKPFFLRVLKETLKQVAPEVQIGDDELFKAFEKAVSKNLRGYVSVSTSLLRK
jgi:hypothetical protein